MDLKELESGVDPSVHWYYQSKKTPLFRFFRQVQERENRALTVIDFGAGSGFFAYELLAAFPDLVKEVLLVDIGYSEAEMQATVGTKVQKMHYIPRGVSDCVVVMMDVLEHLSDDYGILGDIRERLGTNAYYFVTVPAFMSLWSGHDVYLEHYRRYTLGTLRGLMESQAERVEAEYYIYGLLFPVAWVVRRLKGLQKPSAAVGAASDMKPVAPVLNALLKQLNIWEMQTVGRLNKVGGITAVSEGRLK